MTVAFVVMLTALGAIAGSQALFPVAKARTEFMRLLPHVRGYCETRQGDVEQFRRAVLPFGPMDLAMSGATADEAEILRNLYLGMVGAACGVDAAKMSTAFDCGSVCVDTRQAELADKRSAILELVRDFMPLKEIDLIAQWGIVDAYRVNNVFVMMGQTKETKASAVMGFVPSESWTDLAGPEEYFRRKGIPERKFRDLLKKIKSLSLVGVVREPYGIRVIRVGIGTKESGLFFPGTQAHRPKVGDRAADGRRYVVVQDLAKDVIAYETN